ncbi:hypothetical protein QYM36_004780 [Artemia franciscana]|uniref:Uncharacterized protein n=1 Tax=Artemia franciscana TaxID=6661 RepID=A0AA88LB98_ARTSF|nr:hypothetical protein QYM36_004780 [Artemia franciscana]
MSSLLVDKFADYDSGKTAVIENGRKEGREYYGEFGRKLATIFNRWLNPNSLKAQPENKVATNSLESQSGLAVEGSRASALASKIMKNYLNTVGANRDRRPGKEGKKQRSFDDKREGAEKSHQTRAESKEKHERFRGRSVEKERPRLKANPTEMRLLVQVSLYRKKSFQRVAEDG